MTSVVLVLVLSVIQPVSPVPSCPAVCVVCSEDAVICNRLAHIIDAPDSTQALLLTEGSISTVQPSSLSDLSNVTVIGLSHNHISVLGEQPFRALPLLHTLLLDHNLLTSQALQGGALTNLTQLQVLALGHNLISMVRGAWFKGSKALRSLTLEGNRLTSLDSGSFPLNDLRYLESLDLSENLIDHLDGRSFVGLVSLQTLDLSRNRLRSAPAEAFSYLSWLTNLNLDLNSWNCSCQLLELAAFLSTFIQQPDKTLYNGRRMVCVSADNPAVTTVLELTEANCVPSNQNITVQIETRGSVTPQMYARDLAITAVICFIGGVGLTLLIVLIYYKVSLRKKLKENEIHQVEGEGSRTMANHLDVSDKRRDLLLQANSSQPWDREVMTFDGRTAGPGHQFRPQADESSSLFRCLECSTEGQRQTWPSQMRWINAGMEEEEEMETRRAKMMTEEERRRRESQQGIFTRDFLSNTNSSSHPRRESFNQRAETLAAYREMQGYRADMKGRSKGRGTFHCESCHKTLRPPEQNMGQGRNHTNMRDFDGFPSQYRQTDRAMNVNHNHFDAMRNVVSRRETRNVTFDLERSGTPEQGNSQGIDEREEGDRATGGKERGRTKAHKGPSSRLLKVKLNLNPLRKSKVHPKRKTEQGHSDKSSSKKSTDKRRDGKEREEGKGKGKSGKRAKGDGDKMKKSTRTKGVTEDSGRGKEEDLGGEGEEKSKRTAKRSGQGGQESTEGDPTETEPPGGSEPGDSSKTADQSASATTTGPGPNVDGGHVQYQGAGLVLGSAPLSSQRSFSLSAADRSNTTSLSLLGSAGTQLGGHSLALQGGHSLLNTTAQGSNALFPGHPARSAAPNVETSGPKMPPSGPLDSFSRQVVTSLLAHTAHANPLQPSGPQTSQPAGLSLNLTADPVENQMPPDSSPLTATLKSDPAQGPSSPTGKGVPQLLPEAQVTIVENLSNNNSQTGHVPVTVDVSAAALAEGHAVSEDSRQAADLSLSGVSASVSPHGLSSTGGAGAAAALLQQEYLSEEGGSSPRRKLRLVLPEKTSGRPPTALERKIR